MRNSVKPVLTGFFITFLVVAVSSSTRPAKIAPSKQPGFAVVELFTSEGCSSCPPADEAVADLAAKYPSNVFVLSYHVDYWNHLGWKDPFSDAAYSARQQQYAAAFQLNSIYTPQAIVNGIEQFTGSEKATLFSTVTSFLDRSDNEPVQLTATASSRKLTVHYATAPAAGNRLCLALLQIRAINAVKNGENKGRTLHHVNIVRVFKTVPAGEGNAEWLLPDGLTARECSITGFLQESGSMHIRGAATVAIQ